MHCGFGCCSRLACWRRIGTPFCRLACRRRRFGRMIVVAARSWRVVAMLPALLVVALAEGFAWRSIVSTARSAGALALALSMALVWPAIVDDRRRYLAQERQCLPASGIAGGLGVLVVRGPHVPVVGNDSHRADHESHRVHRRARRSPPSSALCSLSIRNSMSLSRRCSTIRRGKLSRSAHPSRAVSRATPRAC